MTKTLSTSVNDIHQPKRQGPKLHVVDVNVDVDKTVLQASYETRKSTAIHDAHLAEVGLILMKVLVSKYKSTYTCYRNMRDRCKAHNIGLSEELSTFPQFLASMGPVPKQGDTLDRINSHGPYLLENVRWADKRTQARNRSNVRTLTVNGDTRLLVEWAELTNQPKERLHTRLARGWTDEEIVTGVRAAGPEPKARKTTALGTVGGALQKLPWPEDDRERWETVYQRNGYSMTRIEFGIDHCVKALAHISVVVEALPPDDADYTEKDSTLANRATEQHERYISALRHFQKPGFARFLAMAGRLTNTEEAQLNKTFGPHRAD